MRAVVRRVSRASVQVAAVQIAEIGPGLLVLVGVTHTDTEQNAAKLAAKVAGLRILRDGDRDDASASGIDAPVLVVSQFTLYADTAAGRRPSWQPAAPAGVAEPLVDRFVQALQERGLSVHTGRFGAQMEVHSINDGPFTILLEL